MLLIHPPPASAQPGGLAACAERDDALDAWLLCEPLLEPSLTASASLPPPPRVRRSSSAAMRRCRRRLRLEACIPSPLATLILNLGSSQQVLRR